MRVRFPSPAQIFIENLSEARPKGGPLHNQNLTLMNKFIYWAPRVLSIIFLAFLALFSLDVISPELSFWQIVLGLFMHNIPVLVLLIVLIISWKYEIVGAIAFILAGLLYIGSAAWRAPALYMAITWSLIIAGPAFLIGILFWVNWRKKKI